MSIKRSNWSRLRQIEKSLQSRRSGTWLTVREDDQEPGVFKDTSGKVYTQEELDSLDDSGTNILKIRYITTPTDEQERQPISPDLPGVYIRRRQIDHDNKKQS